MKTIKARMQILIFLCVILGIAMIITQLGIVQKLQLANTRHLKEIESLNLKLDEFRLEFSKSKAVLGKEKDSLQSEMGRIRDLVNHTKQLLQKRDKLIDSAYGRVAEYKKEQTLRLAELDSLDEKIRLVKEQITERLTEKKELKLEIEKLKELLSGALRKIARLQSFHTVKVLFVYDNYISSDKGKRDETITFGKEKGALITLFDSCAALNTWHERYCDLPKIVYGINAGARYIEIKNISQKYNLTYESLYFLAKAAGYDPKNVQEWQLKEIVSMAYTRFYFEQKLSFDNVIARIQSPFFQQYCSNQKQRFKNGKGW